MKNPSQISETTRTSSKKILPNFFIIGAARSGTTSLHNYLNQHPDIFMSTIKEPNFFAFENQQLDPIGPPSVSKKELFHHLYRATITDIDSYHALFEGVTHQKAIGESSPRYLYFPKAPDNIHSRVPDAKIIAILRNPVHRAFSHYHMVRRWGAEPLCFSDAIKEEDARVEKKWEWDWHYMRLGYYYEQLKRYYDVFGTEKIKIVLYDDLIEDPVRVTGEIFAFLGVDESFIPNMSFTYNKATFARSKPLDGFIRKKNPLKSIAKRILPLDFLRAIKKKILIYNKVPDTVDPKLHEQLIVRLRPEIEKIQGLIGRDLSRWLTVHSEKNVQKPEHLPGYVRRDWEVVDYKVYSLGNTGLYFRGPRPIALEKNKYIVCLGAAQTFGCFCQRPFSHILEERLGIPVLNLGYGGAGPGFFLKHQPLWTYINDAQLVIVQVMSGRSESNRLFDSGGLEYLTRRCNGEKIGADKAYQELLKAPHLIPSIKMLHIKQLIEETRKNWVLNYKDLLSAIKTKRILFWFSEREPDYKEDYSDAYALFGKFPQLVNKKMIESIKDCADKYVECIGSSGLPQPLISRFSGEATVVDCSLDRPDFKATWTHNNYYPSPEMHEEAATALLQELAKLTSES